MTTNQQPSANDVTAASQEMLDRVAQDVFFNKMAAAGFPAQSPEHGASMIQDALLVQQMLNQPQVKEAFAQNNVTAQASSTLRKMATDLGVLPGTAEDQDADFGVERVHKPNVIQNDLIASIKYEFAFFRKLYRVPESEGEA